MARVKNAEMKNSVLDSWKHSPGSQRWVSGSLETPAWGTVYVDAGTVHWGVCAGRAQANGKAPNVDKAKEIAEQVAATLLRLGDTQGQDAEGASDEQALLAEGGLVVEEQAYAWRVYLDTDDRREFPLGNGWRSRGAAEAFACVLVQHVRRARFFAGEARLPSAGEGPGVWLSPEQADALTRWAEATITGFGPTFTAAFEVAKEIVTQRAGDYAPPNTQWDGKELWVGNRFVWLTYDGNLAFATPKKEGHEVTYVDPDLMPLFAAALARKKRQELLDRAAAKRQGELPKNYSLEAMKLPQEELSELSEPFTFKLTQADDPTQTHTCTIPASAIMNLAALKNLRGGRPVQGYTGGRVGEARLVFFLDAADSRVGPRGCVVEYDSPSCEWADSWYGKRLIVEILE